LNPARTFNAKYCRNAQPLGDFLVYNEVATLQFDFAERAATPPGGYPAAWQVRTPDDLMKFLCQGEKVYITDLGRETVSAGSRRPQTCIAKPM